MAVKRDNTTGTWFYYGSYRINGKLKQYKKRGFEKKKDAIKAEILFKENLKEPNASITFKELSYQYQVYSESRIKESTAKVQETMLNAWEDSLGDKELREITSNDISKAMNQLSSIISFGTMKNYFAKLNAVMSYAVKHGYIEKNPCDSIELKKDPNKKKKEMQFWTVEQFSKFIDEIDERAMHLFFMNQFYMGTRMGEALALRWSDVDLKNNTINIEKTWNQSLRKCTTPKTHNSYRKISLPLFLANEYNALKSDLKASESDYIFGIEIPYGQWKLRDTMLKGIKRANMKLESTEQIPFIRIHDLRHSCASYMIANMVSDGETNFSVYDIAKRLGDSLDTVLSVYAHWLPQADKRIVDFMDKDNQKE